MTNQKSKNQNSSCKVEKLASQPKKPDTHKTLLLTFLQAEKPPENYVLDLADVSIEHKTGYVLFTLDLPKKVLNKSYTKSNFVLAISDDPTMNHACDWTQLGCSRFRYSGENVKMTKSKKIQFKVQNFSFEMLQPERRFPHNAETKFHIW